MTEETIPREPDTTDLERALRLSRLKPATRTATIQSLRTMRDAAGTEGRLHVAALEALVAAPPVELRAALGKRATQVLSDAGRALRHWNEPGLRWLALRLAGPIPMLDLAVAAAQQRLPADEARRAEAAIEALAASHGTRPEELAATAATVEPLLRAATPETFGVASAKSLENKRTLVRKALRLVDLTRTGARETDIRALPAAWRAALARVEAVLQEHEQSPRAICRRLARFADLHGARPGALPGPLILAFVEQERATHAAGYDEKLRAAFARWNRAAEAAPGLDRIAIPPAPGRRQATVRWVDVPAGIREPLEARLADAMSVHGASDLGALVPDEDPEYADLGLGSLASEPAEGALVLASGTRGNWRAAVKRVWHAAETDPRIDPKPSTLAGLFDIACVRAMVAAVRRARRADLEARGEVFDPRRKGRYEHSLVETICAVGCAMGIAPDKLEPLEDLKRAIDPSIVTWKVATDGSRKAVYAERKIGARHARMLAAFAEDTVLRRWFEAPAVLWTLACAPLGKTRKPGQTQVALARSALLARLGQCVGPLRRTNLARLRYKGEAAHLLLPIGSGEGTLRIPAIETKTLAEIHIRIDPETVKMLKVYIEHFLPVARKTARAKKDNPHLFPGAGGSRREDGGYAAGFGYLTKSKLNTAFKRHLRKHCQLDLCLHVMRHLAGKVILDQDPSAMELVRCLLGHRRIETTRSYYAEVSALVAQRRYLHLLERGMRRVLADFRFSFIDTAGKPLTTRETKNGKAPRQHAA